MTRLRGIIKVGSRVNFVFKVEDNGERCYSSKLLIVYYVISGNIVYCILIIILFILFIFYIYMSICVFCVCSTLILFLY
jgi:hypothetical protein